MAANALGESEGEALASLYEYLNPVQLRPQMDEALQTVWQMAHPDARTKAEAAALARLEAQQPCKPTKNGGKP